MSKVIDGSSTRRDFLKFLASSALALSGVELAKTYLSDGSNVGSAAYGKGSYKLDPWTGDDFRFGHLLRDGKIPKFKCASESKVDTVIVGGGMAGLTCAFNLKDQSFLLLDQFDDLGGQSRCGTYNGMDFSYGPAYMADPEGAIADVLAYANVTPAKLEESKNSFYWDNKWYRGVEGLSNSKFQGQLDMIKKDVTKVLANRKGDVVEWFNEDPDAKKLDSVTLGSYLQSYDKEFVGMLDNFCMSALCVGADKTSALSGFVLIEDLYHTSYVAPGGNPGIAKALAKKLVADRPDSFKRGVFVWSIELKDNGATIIYGDRKGRQHKVECKHVAMAIPHMVSARITKNMSNEIKGKLLQYKYGSYLVANMCLRKRIFDGSYDNWLPTPHKVADVITAETPYKVNGGYKEEMGQILTVYVPYEPNSIGRGLLFQGDRKKLSTDVLKEMEGFIPDLVPNLDRVVLSRWGHALAVTVPKFFENNAYLMQNDSDVFSFAHSSTQGIPCIEGAAEAGKRAAQKARKVKAQSKVLYSIV